MTLVPVSVHLGGGSDGTDRRDRFVTIARNRLWWHPRCVEFLCVLGHARSSRVQRADRRLGTPSIAKAVLAAMGFARGGHHGSLGRPGRLPAGGQLATRRRQRAGRMLRRAVDTVRAKPLASERETRGYASRRLARPVC
jgi:hypothetical protein